MRQRILNEVATSLSRKIRKRGKLDPLTFQSACETFVKVIEMMEKDPPPEETIKEMKEHLNRLASATGVS
jgi:hypothetical protein